MQLIYKIVLIILMVGCVNNLFSQNTNHDYLNNKKLAVNAGYGIFSFYEVEDKNLYDNINSTGIIHGSLKYIVNEKFSTGIWVGTEMLKCEINNSNTDYYVNRFMFLTRTEFNLVNYNNFDLFVAASGGVLRESKHLFSVNETVMQPVYDFVLLGIRLKINNFSGLYFETGYSKLSLFRAGVFIAI